MFYNKINHKKIIILKSKKLNLIHTPLKQGSLDFNFILERLYNEEISSILVEAGKTLINSLLNKNFFNEFYLFISSKKLQNQGLSRMKNIKNSLSNKFKKYNLNETFLDNDNLIHYY